jgi:EAL domain-containing protein (putative c-di-GMP-specific phosphodiesterase class I)
MIPKSALIIDDDPIFHLVAEEALRAIGTEDISLAEDGAIGLDIITKAPAQFDLVICDLQMPNLDGISVLRELGRISFKGALIIISSEEEDLIGLVRRMAQMVGVRVLGTLKKPLTVENLRAILVKNGDATVHAEATPVTRHALKTALSENRLVPYYQPKVDLRSNRISGVEVLTRVLDEDGLPADPTRMLRAAEQYDLMMPFTLSIIKQTVSDYRRFKSVGCDLECAINLSPSMLSDLDLPDALTDICRASKVDPSRITLEITENQFIEYKANVLEVLSRLRLRGFRLSIDDFGTGATSIEQLRLFPCNELKIDKSFVGSALEDPFAKTTVETSIRLAAMLQMSVVAEGVETVEQLAYVRISGANFAQGYLFSEPLPAKELANWITNFDPNSLAAA